MLRKVFAIVCVVLLLGVGVVSWLREDADERLERALGKQSLESIRGQAPALDHDLQMRLWQWMQSREVLRDGWSSSLTEDWFLQGQPSPSERIAAAHERDRAAMDELTEMLSTGRACLTSMGWLDEAHPHARDAFRGLPLRHARIPKLLGAARWYALEAMCAADPTPALARLRDLCTALGHPGSSFDCLYSARLRGVRDRAYLCMVLRARISDDVLEAWVGEASGEIERLAQGMRMERIRYATSVGEDLEARRYLDWNQDIDMEDRLQLWWKGKGDLASWLELCDAFEAYLQGTGTAETVRRREADNQARAGLPKATPGYHVALLDEALLVNAQHRVPRLAARVLQLSRQHGRLPRDVTELRVWTGSRASLLDASPFELALTYDRLAERAFRVRVDPATAVPDLLPAAAMDRVREEQSRVPHGTRILWWPMPHLLEVHLPDP